MMFPTVAVVLCLSLCIVYGQMCTYGNTTYTEGETFKPDRCNTCFCSQGDMVCTKVYCPLQQETTCTYNNRTYPAGTSFKPDRCNTCYCVHGMAACTKVFCQP